MTLMVTRAQAQESCERFWQWFNSDSGCPEHHPEEEVIRFLSGRRAQLGEKVGEARVLDLGSGSGKHSVLVASLGFQLVCVDWSAPGLDYTRRRLEKESLSGQQEVTDFRDHKLPFESDYFDFVVGMQVFDHVFDADARALLEEVRRVTKPCGEMLLSLMTTGTTKKNRLGRPVEGEARTFLCDEGNSAGEIHRLFTPDEADEFVSSKFTILDSVVISFFYDRRDEVAEAKYFTVRKQAG